ncbi:MAG: DNA adenine methylase [Pseudomonadota bacterium]
MNAPDKFFFQPKYQTGVLSAPFTYFGGKSKASELVWKLFGEVSNYVEPFAGSAAMLLAAPSPVAVETLNDFDGFISNFWRSISKAPEEVAYHADWPLNETDLFARHAWLVRQRESLTEKLHDPEYFDAKIAGYWVWGIAAWIGDGYCSGAGPWEWSEEMNKIVDRRRTPAHESTGLGVHRKMPRLGDTGTGINRRTNAPRYEFILGWFNTLYSRLRDVRVCSGDWSRVLSPLATTYHGVTAVFLDPPYEAGDMDYSVGGVGEGIAANVRAWCAVNGNNPKLRIVLCGHDGEHDELCALGWTKHHWKAGPGYANPGGNFQDETVWASPACLQPEAAQSSLF